MSPGSSLSSAEPKMRMRGASGLFFSVPSAVQVLQVDDRLFAIHGIGPAFIRKGLYRLGYGAAIASSFAGSGIIMASTISVSRLEPGETQHWKG